MLDPRTHNHQTNTSFQLYDETRHKTWEATTNSDFNWPSSRPEPMELDTSSDNMRSPPRWTTTTIDPSHYRTLSPTSRTEAIVRGQRELMEMVKNMPESNYELSLKDLVEHHHRVVATTEEEKKKVENNNNNNNKMMPRVKSVKKVQSSGGGFYLKVAFPFSLGSNKDKKKKKMKTKKNENSGNSSKVSDNGSVKEWWKKSPSVLRESDSGESSINSGSMKSSGSSSTNSSSSRRSNSRREKGGGGCWRFIRRPKSQKKK